MLMYEIRVRIPSDKIFRKKMHEKNGEKIRSFKFKDTYFVPKNLTSDWKNGIFTMRLRNEEGRSSLYFTRYEIIELEGFTLIQNSNGQKIPVLIDQSHKAVHDFLSAIDFKEVFSIERTLGEVWKIKIDRTQDLELTFEHIVNLGHTSEIELKEEEIKNSYRMQFIKELLNELGAACFTKSLFGVYMETI